MSDRHVESVKHQLDERSARGLQKYGVSTEREDLNPRQWLRHLQEELLDASIYIERVLSYEPVERIPHEGKVPRKVNEQDVKA